MPDDATLASHTASHGDPSLRVKGLDHVVLRVADIDTSIASIWTAKWSMLRPMSSSSVRGTRSIIAAPARSCTSPISARRRSI